ncbi:MAG: glycosyltransferase [archaeon]|nr:glycosyltransferase [archaeon]
MANKPGAKEELKGEKLDILFEEEIKKPYYRVDYLDNFRLPHERLDVSAIIPTYNRSPYRPGSLRAELNPLAWAIKSMLLQKPSINEIIVFDDASEDYTEEVVKSFMSEAQEKKIKLVYKKSLKHVGYGRAINFAVTLANSKYLFFIDDDSIVAPYASFGGVYTFEWLVSEGVNVGIINLPPYLRSALPENFVSKKEISQIDFFKGIYLSNKASFPLEYIRDEDKFIHDEYHILKPFPIQNSGGYTLCSKKVFVEIGGFPTTIYERFVEREFGCMAIDNGYSVYFQPDLKFHCVHGSYGLHNNRNFSGDDWFRRIGGQISLKKAMEICNEKRENTGCRINQKEFLYHSMAAIFSILYPRNNRGAIRWMRKVYDEFVLNGDSKILNTRLLDNLNQKERKQIWDTALKESLGFIKKKETLKLNRINKIKSAVEKKNITPETLNLLIEPL